MPTEAEEHLGLRPEPEPPAPRKPNIFLSGLIVWCAMLTLGALMAPLAGFLVMGLIFAAASSSGGGYHSWGSELLMKAVAAVLFTIPQTVSSWLHIPFPASLLIWAIHYYFIALWIAFSYHVLADGRRARLAARRAKKLAARQAKEFAASKKTG
jgi:hypothetical protein